jgi:hypothetical protein
MRKSDPEVNLLNKSIEVGMQSALRVGVKRTLFIRWQNVWDFCEKFFLEHNTTPTMDTVQEKFEVFPSVSVPEPLEHYFHEVEWSYERSRYIRYVDELNQAIKDDPEQCKRLTTNLYVDIVCRPSFMDDISSGDLKDSYKLITSLEQDFALGIPTGFDVLDDEIGGIMAGEFWGIIGPPYTAKTWTLINLGLQAVRKGKNVLLISCEMIPQRVWIRFLSLLFELPAKRVRQGRLTIQEKKTLKGAVKTVEELPGKITIIKPSSRGIASIREKIYQYNPDIVLIDAWYDLVDEDLHIAMGRSFLFSLRVSNVLTWKQEFLL